MSKSLLPEHDVACTEGQARALLATSRDLLAVVSASGHFLFVNESFTRAFGYLPEELVGQPLSLLNAPADAGLLGQRFAALAASPEGTASWRSNLRTKSGQYRWFNAEAVNRVADPSVGAVLVSYQDVTEIQRMEAQRTNPNSNSAPAVPAEQAGASGTRQGPAPGGTQSASSIEQPKPDPALYQEFLRWRQLRGQ